jgi:hypothetical protein
VLLESASWFWLFIAIIRSNPLSHFDRKDEKISTMVNLDKSMLCTHKASVYTDGVNECTVEIKVIIF